MTIEELAKDLEDLKNRYEELERDYLYLRRWSDNNDYWLREMIDALTESVGGNWDKFDIVFKRLNDLEDIVYAD